MTTVYVVTEGCYSDYGISGVFSTKEKAKYYIKNNPLDHFDEYHDIEEWILDELQHDTTKTVWYCELDTLSGAITQEWNYTHSCRGPVTRTNNSDVRVWASSSISKEHCHKLAVEKRQAVLREKIN